MTAAVSKEHTQSDDEPDNKPQPVIRIETRDQEQIENHSENGHQGNQRRLEWARQVGALFPQDDDPDAHQREREQRSHADELTERRERQQAGSDADSDPRQGAHVWSPEPGMHTSEHRRKKSVATHRVEDARLPKQLNEHRAEQAEERAELHDGREPRQPRRRDADRNGIGDIEPRIRHDANEDDGDRNVQHGA